jgi:hypothetical protein
MRIYGFQITPGSDHSFGYCKTADDAYQKAREHRQDIMRAAAPDRLNPTAVYEVEVVEVTAESLVAVLNDPDTLAEALVLSKRLLGFVTED